ncbi:hypothetical protein [Pedobacter frigoris]|uniref:Uncharacterized protein n=1 Tax=Pedobacter frigoris TaxID=2571272 RepID=A0A4U1CL15_9SPHI|nr:hypothetical protein [Pedobacter frigoris]TKC06961.1 hypothetical protein FA047_06730 [Pedobacter frigoris]
MNIINTKTPLCVVLLLGIILLGNSCKRGLEIQNQPEVVVNETILKAKAHVESILEEQGSDSFVKKMRFEMNWEKAIIDSADNIRVPIYFDLSKLKPKDGKQKAPAEIKAVFELYIKNVSGQTEVSIMQFMNVGGKYYPLRLTLTGELKTKLKASVFKKDVLSIGGNGGKILSSAFNKKMITESGFMELIQMSYGSNYLAVVIRECQMGTWFNPTTCMCDWPENVDSGGFYPEIFMIIIDAASNYQYLPYPFSFHPSSITPDPEYPEGPIGGGGNTGGNVDCAGVTGGTAHMADCGCIGGTTGIQNCDQMCTVSAMLSSIASTVRPGTNINLNATITTSGAVSITDKAFEVYYQDTWLEGSIKFDTEFDQGNTYAINNAEINVLGALKYRLKIIYTCNGVESTTYSNEVNTYSRYTSTEFLSEFASQMSSAWSQTVASTTASQGTKFEHGFAVYYRAATRNVELDGATVSASAACGVATFGVTLSERTLSGTIDPFYGANFTVGNFHTHPPLTFCSSNESLAPGPSNVDLGFTTNYPRIVRTYTNTVSGGHNINLSLTDHLTHSKTVTDY